MRWIDPNIALGRQLQTGLDSFQRHLMNEKNQPILIDNQNNYNDIIVQESFNDK